MRIGKQKPARSPTTEPTRERTPALVEGELFAARVELEDCREALAASEAAYLAALDHDRAVALAAEARVRETKVDRDIASRKIERLEAELIPLLAGARTAAEAAERAAFVEDAEAKAARYASAFAKHYPDIVDQARLLIRLQAEADIAREAAIQAGASLPPTDGFRGIQGREREILSRRTDELWRNPHGGVFADHLQAQIETLPDGRGILRGERPIYATQRQRVETVTFLPGRPARIAARLATALSLPAAVVGGPPGWAVPAKTDPRSILKELDRIEQLPPADDSLPAPKTSSTPVGPPVDVTSSTRSRP